MQAQPGTGWERHGSGRRHYGEVFGEGLWIETYSWEAKVTLFITTSRGSWLPGSQSDLWRPLSPPGTVVILQAHSSPEDNCFWYGKNNLVKRDGKCCFFFFFFFLFFCQWKNEKIKKKERALWKVLIHQKTRVKREQYAPFWLFSSLPLFFSFFPWRLEMWRNVFWSALTEPGPCEEGG